MGYASYSTENRSFRASSEGYHTKSKDAIFTQSKEKRMHNLMNPSGIVARECRDSAAHPNAIPIQLYLDVTGSMDIIPHDLIKDGLPTLMGTLTQRGVPDAALMFAAIGDHETDSAPLQVSQFESGDAELDMWLTRTWIEGGGGANAGESYPLAWYFGANHVKTDAFDKRKQKGFIISIGDEPYLKTVPQAALKEIMGNTAVGQVGFSANELLADAQKENHVFHIFLEHGRRECDAGWKQLLGSNLVVLSDYKDVPKTIAKIILDQLAKDGHGLAQGAKRNEKKETATPATPTTPPSEPSIIL